MVLVAAEDVADVLSEGGDERIRSVFCESMRSAAARWTILVHWAARQGLIVDAGRASYARAVAERRSALGHHD
ncbi:hypothetical protein [Micromonospora luteifusca]|uniref:hypothetical protein n=1 Tax=Micromonospora luteifusca TaxID=709860 RepID=UPI0033A7CD25